MDRFRNALVALTLFSAVLVAPVSAQDDDGLHRLTTSVGGVAFEVVGQVTNFPPAGAGQPATSQQYGYLSTINGLSADQVFNTSIPTLQNESTARFTFFTDAITERVISNGRLRIVNRTGTTTIYLDESSGGDFGNRDTFRDGVPILRMNYRQQVILDAGEANPSVPGTGTFTVMNLLSVTGVSSFEIGGERFQISRQKDQFRQFYSGVPPTLAPPIGVFAGYTVVIDRSESDRD